MSIPAFSQRQAYTIQGKVTGADGEALLGATVHLAAHQTGTVTDNDGTYALKVSANAGTYVLRMSYVGYQTIDLDVVLGSASTVTVDAKLQVDFLRLTEVVVTGASAATAKQNLGNAISTVNANDISESGAQSIDQALSGKLSGALISQNSGNPAGGISVTLRGTSTVFGSSDPLYIIDGVIVDNSSPELIDLGGYAQNRLVDINPNDIERIEVIKGAAAAALYGSRASNGVVQIFTKKGVSGAPRIDFSTSIKVNSLRKEIEENLEPFRFEAVNDATNTNLIPTERYKMQDYIFDNGYGTDNYLSISGGAADTRYYLSGSYTKNEGIIRNTNFERYTARANVDQVLGDWISVGFGLGYTYSQSDEIPNGGIAEVYGALTGYNFNNTFFDPSADADGNYLSPAGFVANPVEVIETFKFGQDVSRFNGNAKLLMSPLRGLSIDFVLGFDTYTQGADGFIPVGSNGSPSGWARTALVTNTLLNGDLNFRYNTNIGDRVSSTSLLGFTAQHDEFRSISTTANNLSPVVNSTSAGSVIGRGDSRSERNIQGAFFQQTFGLWDKVYVTGAIRVDAASPFGKYERTQMYPKASISYLISEEEFLKNSDFISTLKIRASYGESGNLSALQAYERLSNYNPTPITGQTGLVPSTRLGNADLKPERQKEIEFGIDAGLFNDRLGVEFSVYSVKVEDLLLTRSLASSTGYATRLENVGEMTNKGFEVMLRAVPVQASKLTWHITATLSSNKNEVNGIEGNQIPLPKSFGVSLARNGQPLGVLDGFIYARDENGEILLTNGLPSRATDANGAIIRQTIGDPNPDWIGSLINELTYDNFALRLQFDAVQGFEVFNFTDRVNSRSAFGGGPRDAEEIRGELPRGYNNAAYNIWERYIEDGSFVKLRELSLSYSVKHNVAWLRDLTFSLIGRNLISFDSYTGWDPETSTAGQTNGVRGFDFNEVPIPRTIQFGVKVGF
jgi:TonB-linked SusC/RagA family outer membrane protein